MKDEAFENSVIYNHGQGWSIRRLAREYRWECGQPIFNRHYLGFASHYGFRPLTIRPGRPAENLKVERPFYYLETNFLNGRSFRNKYVPGDQLFKSCPLRITSDQVIIYSHDFKPLLAHPLATKGATGRYIGLPPTYTHGRVLKLSEVKQRLSAMGGIMQRYVEKLILQKKDPTFALNALLALKVHYFTEDILKAVERAMNHGVYDIKTIERFLKAHTQGRDAIKTLFDQIPDNAD